MIPVAPAFPNDDAFFCRFFTEVGSFVDTANRRLHEVDFRSEEVGGAYVRCPFRDTRQGFLMNKAALTQITAEWAEVLQGVNFFTSLYPVVACEDATFGRAWRICMSSMFAPLYLFKRGVKPIENGKLPTPISGVFKIMLDVPTTMDLMILARHEEGIIKSNARELSEDIRHFADNSHILLNGNYACAGAPGLIESVVGTLFEGRPSERFGVFSELFNETEEFNAFSYYMSCQYAVSTLYLLTTMIAMERAFTEARDNGKFEASHHESEPLSAYERRRRFALAQLTPERCASALTAYASLAEKPDELSIGRHARFDVSRALDASLRLLSETGAFDVGDIVSRYERYQNLIEDQLQLIQNWAEVSIAARSLFSRPIRFGEAGRHPIEVLKNVR